MLIYPKFIFLSFSLNATLSIILLIPSVSKLFSSKIKVSIVLFSRSIFPMYIPLYLFRFLFLLKSKWVISILFIALFCLDNTSHNFIILSLVMFYFTILSFPLNSEPDSSKQSNISFISLSSKYISFWLFIRELVFVYSSSDWQLTFSNYFKYSSIFSSKSKLRSFTISHFLSINLFLFFNTYTISSSF